MYWQRMFHLYSLMVKCESLELGYANGIYAGDLFVTKDGCLKQRDWNIRRGGRSSPESLIIFGMPNYETKVILPLEDFHLNKKLTNLLQEKKNKLKIGILSTCSQKEEGQLI